MKQQAKIILLKAGVFLPEEIKKLGVILFEITGIKYIPIEIPDFDEIIKSIEI